MDKEDHKSTLPILNVSSKPKKNNFKRLVYIIKEDW